MQWVPLGRYCLPPSGESGVGVKLSGGDAVNSFTCGGYVVKLSGIRGGDTDRLPPSRESGYRSPWVSVGVGELFS